MSRPAWTLLGKETKSHSPSSHDAIPGAQGYPLDPLFFMEIAEGKFMKMACKKKDDVPMKTADIP
jgi:hypothetical protein